MAYKERIDLDTVKAQVNVEKLAKSAARLKEQFSAAYKQAGKLARSELGRKVALLAAELAGISNKQVRIIKNIWQTVRAARGLINAASAVIKKLSNWRALLSKIQQVTPGAISRIGNLFKSLGSHVRKFSSAIMKPASSIKNLSARVNKPLDDMRKKADEAADSGKKFSGVADMWWKRFGQVAIAFTIAYRAMNAVEAALRHLTETIVDSIRVSGELASTQAKLALWAVTLSDSTIKFANAFHIAKGYTQELMRASATSLSTFEELTVVMDEFAQAGVILPKRLIPAMASLADFTKMIALTTGSSIRQLRQEIQSLMEGQVKASNVLIRTAVRFGWLTEKEVKSLKAMRGGIEVAEKLLSKIHAHWKDVLEIITSNNVVAGLTIWRDIIKRMFIDSIELASSWKGVGNIFGDVVYNHILKMQKAVNEDAAGMKKRALLMSMLAKALDKALSAYEWTIDAISNLTTVFYNNKNAILAAVKAFMLYEEALLMNKLGSAILSIIKNVASIENAFKRLTRVIRSPLIFVTTMWYLISMLRSMVDMPGLMNLIASGLSKIVGELSPMGKAIKAIGKSFTEGAFAKMLISVNAGAVKIMKNDVEALKDAVLDLWHKLTTDVPIPTLADTKVTGAFENLARGIGNTSKSLSDLADASDNFWEGFSIGIKKIEKDSKSTGRMGFDAVIDAVKTLTKSYSDFLYDVVSGAARIEDVWKNLTNSIIRMWSDAMAEMMKRDVFKPALEALGKLFYTEPTQPQLAVSGPQPAVAGPTPVIDIEAPFHTGGIIGEGIATTHMVPASIFDSAVKAHKGLGPSEVPIIAQRGEGVFTPEQMKALGGTTATIYISAMDSQSMSDALKRNRAAVVGPILDAIRLGDKRLSTALRSA